MIRVLIVEDSALQASMIKETLEEDPEISVIGITSNGEEAVQLTAKLKPNVITMDIHLDSDSIDGLEATKQIMAFTPTPILVLSQSTIHHNTEKAFLALSYGAVDVMGKESIGLPSPTYQNTSLLAEAIKTISKIKVVSHPLAKLERIKEKQAKEENANFFKSQGYHKIVGIASSTGGPQALQEVLKDLPSNFQAPILIVQHISPGFSGGLVEWLQHYTSLKINLAKHGDAIQISNVYLAPTGQHMKLNSLGKIELVDTPPVSGERPSGTVLLESIAHYAKEMAIGVILTGMGRDGAAGIQLIYNKGGQTIAQDEASSVVYGMPKAAVDLGGVTKILPLQQIAKQLISWVQ